MSFIENMKIAEEKLKAMGMRIPGMEESVERLGSEAPTKKHLQFIVLFVEILNEYEYPLDERLNILFDAATLALTEETNEAP